MSHGSIARSPTAVRRGTGKALILALMMSLYLGHEARGATLKADYGFNDSRASSVPGAPNLTDIDSNPQTGPGNDNLFATETIAGTPRRVLTFPQGNGLSLSTAGVIPDDSYTIAVRFRFNDTAGYRRIIDFKAGTSDAGLYNRSGHLSFFGSEEGTGTPITPSAANDPYHEVLLSRDALGLVIGFVDGIEQFRFNDVGRNAVIGPARTLIFFKDDAQVSSEESAGAVANIRLFDGPVVPPPELGETVNVSVLSGRVRVAQPGSGRLVPLTGGTQIPVGATVDTRRGKVRLASAVNQAGKTQTGRFSGGLFKVRQARRAGAVTELALTGGSFRSCARGRLARRSGSNRPLRRVLAAAERRSRFRSRGRYSAATVRGTKWLTVDRCDGTLTRVIQGRVAVRDFARGRTVLVRAGQSYLAGPR
jgi:hypothetical protein